MADDRYLHIVMVNVPPEVEKEFNEWYERVHLPDILACPGWLNARRYTVLEGGPKYMAVYELAGLWAYETKEFLRAKGFGKFESYIKNLTRIRGLQIFSMGPETAEQQK